MRLEPGGHLSFRSTRFRDVATDASALSTPAFRSTDWTTTKEGAPGTRCAARRVTRAAARRRLRARGSRGGDARDVGAWCQLRIRMFVRLHHVCITLRLTAPHTGSELQLTARSVFGSRQEIARPHTASLFAPRVRRRTHEGTFKMVRSRPTPIHTKTRRRARRDARLDATRGPASPRASTPRGRNAGCSRSPRGFPPGSRRGAAAGDPERV